MKAIKDDCLVNVAPSLPSLHLIKLHSMCMHLFLEVVWQNYLQ